MRSFIAMVVLALAAGTASASQLDFTPSLLGSDPTPTQLQSSMDSKATFESSNGPIRHRRPRDRYRDREDYGYRSQPEYFAMLGAGTFDPSNQPGNGLYVNAGLGSVLAEQLDLGVQISWYHRATGGDQFVREGNLPDGTHYRQVMTTQSIKTDLVPVMGTLRVRIPVTSQVQPYVGGAA